MDGRKLKSWCLAGGLFLSAVGCKSDKTYPQNMLPQSGIPTAQAASTPEKVLAQANHLEVATPRKKGPLSPEFEVAMAETRLEVALKDPPPPNRDEILDSVRACYQRALKQNPKHKEALLGIARMYAKLGDRERATEAYDKYLKHYPKEAEVLHELAMKRGQWKDWNGAVASCEAAIKLDPENRTYRKTLGFCQARAGMWDAALASLCKIMPEAQARMNLAGILDHLGQGDASRQQLELALQADPQFGPAREFLNGLLEPDTTVQQAGLNEPK